jgi:hypothetical protein
MRDTLRCYSSALSLSIRLYYYKRATQRRSAFHTRWNQRKRNRESLFVHSSFILLYILCVCWALSIWRCLRRLPLRDIPPDGADRPTVYTTWIVKCIYMSIVWGIQTVGGEKNICEDRGREREFGRESSIGGRLDIVVRSFFLLPWNITKKSGGEIDSREKRRNERETDWEKGRLKPKSLLVSNRWLIPLLFLLFFITNTSKKMWSAFKF